MPEEPARFSKGAEKLIGEFRGIAFTEPWNMRRRSTTPLGYPADQPLPKTRKPLADLVRYERW